MTLNELIKYQKRFDRNHSSNFEWSVKISEKNIEMLEFLLLSITGELGETANIVKKIVRGDFSLAEKKTEIAEELADIFIYLLKLSYQLDINLESAYFNKMKQNEVRFRHYEHRNK